MKKFIANVNDAGQRLDKFTQKVCKNMPNALMYKGIRKGRVKVDGKKVREDYKIQEGDLLELYFNDEFFEIPDENISAKLVDVKLNVVYEDNDILILDKPAGQLVHSDDKEGINTLIVHVLAYLEYNPANENTFAPALCNRLDRNTAGLVIAAKNAEALRDMNEIIKQRRIRKTYRCVVVGTPNPKKATLTGFLKRDKDISRVFIGDEGKPIITKYKVVEECGELAVLEVELVTGRTHQIRAHLASIGHPILGDGKYGNNAINKRFGAKYQQLIAWKLEFPDGKLFESNMKMRYYIEGTLVEI